MKKSKLIPFLVFGILLIPVSLAAILVEDEVIDLRQPFVINVNTDTSSCSGGEIELANGTCIDSGTLGGGGGGGNLSSTQGPYLYDNGATVFFNETKLNATIDDRAPGGSGSADGNASSICSSDEVLLGNGTCLTSSVYFDDTDTVNSLTNVAFYNNTVIYIDIQALNWTNITITESQILDLTHITDTNETAFVNNLNREDCQSGQVAIGIYANGSLQCAIDATGSTDLTNVAYLNNTNIFTAGQHFPNFTSNDYSNITLTESQILDLDHIGNNEITLLINNITGTDHNACSTGNFVNNITFENGDLIITCDAPAGSGDITSVIAIGPLILEGGTSSDVNISANLTWLNTTISSLAGTETDPIWTANLTGGLSDDLIFPAAINAQFGGDGDSNQYNMRYDAEGRLDFISTNAGTIFQISDGDNQTVFIGNIRTNNITIPGLPSCSGKLVTNASGAVTCGTDATGSTDLTNVAFYNNTVVYIDIQALNWTNITGLTDTLYTGIQLNYNSSIPDQAYADANDLDTNFSTGGTIHGNLNITGSFTQGDSVTNWNGSCLNTQVQGVLVQSIGCLI